MSEAARATKRRVMGVAMDLATTVAEGDHSPDVLAFIAANLDTATTAAANGTMTQLDADITRMLTDAVGTVLDRDDLADAGVDPDGDPLVLVQRSVAVRAVANGLLSDDELRDALAQREMTFGEWSNLGGDLPATPVPGLSATETDEQPPAQPVPPRSVLHAQRAAEPVADDVIDAEVASTEIVPAGRPTLVDEQPSGQRRYRVPGGYNPRDTGIGGYARSVTPNRPTVHLDTSDPHLGDRR